MLEGRRGLTQKSVSLGRLRGGGRAASQDRQLSPLQGVESKCPSEKWVGESNSQLQ